MHYSQLISKHSSFLNELMRMYLYLIPTLVRTSTTPGARDMYLTRPIRRALHVKQHPPFPFHLFFSAIGNYPLRRKRYLLHVALALYQMDPGNDVRGGKE